MKPVRCIFAPASAALCAAVAAVAIALCCAAPAYAATSEAGWSVTLDADGKMASTYAQQKDSIDEALSGLQPGDSFTLSIKLNNQNAARTSWYMTSKAIKTLEEASNASNGAYSFKLLYNNEPIYESDTVGGDGSSGFTEVSNATGDWFWLGYIDSGQSGDVQIQMALDGETQDNSYMSTVGRLSVSFAVEFNDGQGKRFVEEGQSAASSPVGSMLQTGDVMLGIGAMLLAAVVCAGLAVQTSRKRKLGKGRDSR